MPYYRVTYEGYIEGEFESSLDAQEEFIRFVEDEDTDQYGRNWQDLVHVEELTED